MGKLFGFYKRRFQAPWCAPKYVLHDAAAFRQRRYSYMGTALNKILKDIIVKHQGLIRPRRPLCAGLGLPRHAH